MNAELSELKHTIEGGEKRKERQILAAFALGSWATLLGNILP